MENDVIDSDTVTEEPAAIENEVVETSTEEPGSMLEAIQKGLEGDKEETEEAAPEEEPEEDKPKAEEVVEPENDEEPPEGISKKAQERFRSMVTKVKEKDAEIERISSDLNGIRSVMKETGGSPEDFAKTFEYIRALNHGDVEHARAILEDQIRQLSVLTGKPFGQVDPLAQFPDLRERVNAYQMDEQTALEMARHRSMQHQQQQAVNQYQQRQQSEQQSIASRQNAIAEIDRLGAEWAKSDPDYSFKEGLITQRAQDIAREFPPEQWAKQVKLMYQTLSSVPAPKPQSAPAPLRASGQSAGARQPSNMLEALQNGLGYGR